MGNDLLIEYVGGPKDGEKKVILKKTPRDKPTFPLEITFSEFDTETQAERRVGSYMRDHMSEAGAMRYLWAHRGEHSKG